MARTIQSPGVEINEIDLSNITQIPAGTNVFIQGFTATGPTHELLNITSISEFESVYGFPTTPAERYAYISAKEIINSPANLIFNRLPYGSEQGEGTASDYSVLAYPYTVIPESSSSFNASAYQIDLFNSQEYQGIVVGKPTMVTLSMSAYEAVKQGNIAATGASWTTSFSSSGTNTILTSSDLHKSAFLVLNDLKTNIESDFSGYYLSVTDNTDLNDTVYNKVMEIQTRLNGDFYELPSSSLTFNLSSTGSIGSVSNDVENGLGFDFSQSSYDDMLQFTLFRLRPDLYSSTGGAQRTSLTRSLIASVPGSLDITRQDTSLTGFNGTVFVEKTIERYSQNYIVVKMNPILASNFAGKKVRMVGDKSTISLGSLSSMGFDTSEFDVNKVQTIVSTITAMGDTDSLVSIGEYQPCNDSQFKIIGETPLKMERGFRLAENRDLIDIDIVCDAGLSTIDAVSHAIDESNAGQEYGGKDIFDDRVFLDLNTLKNPTQSIATSDPSYQRWMGVYNTIQSFCSEVRKDCMFIVDPLRHIFVQGSDSKVLNNKNSSFSQDILVPLRNLSTNTNNNYGAIYGNWVKSYDSSTDSFTWNPFSAYQAAIIARMDSVLQPWFAPAGLNNGLVRNIVDIAITPNQKERDSLYRFNINPVTQFPGDGFVTFGQKTLQLKPSAFDRINVRRLFLVLEKATRRIARYFVFEPNTIYSRTRLVNVLKPLFENAKNNQGLYDYRIVADERVNTPDVIDRLEMRVSIYIKPTRASEFVLIDFIATRTGDDFSEVIGA